MFMVCVCVCVCVLTTLVGRAAAVCGVGLHRQNFSLQADRWRLWTSGANCGHAAVRNVEPRGREAGFQVLTADMSKAAAALGSGGDQSLVIPAGRNLGLTQLRTALCNTHTENYSIQLFKAVKIVLSHSLNELSSFLLRFFVEEMNPRSQLLLSRAEAHHTCGPGSRSPACSTTPISLRVYRREAEGGTDSGYTLHSQMIHRHPDSLLASPITCFLSDPPQTFCGQQLETSTKLMITSPVRWHVGASAPEQLYSTGTMVSLSHRYMQQPSCEAFQTSPCTRGTPELSVQATNRHSGHGS